MLILLKIVTCNYKYATIYISTEYMGAQNELWLSDL